MKISFPVSSKDWISYPRPSPLGHLYDAFSQIGSANLLEPFPFEREYEQFSSPPELVIFRVSLGQSIRRTAV